MDARAARKNPPETSDGFLWRFTCNLVGGPVGGGSRRCRSTGPATGDRSFYDAQALVHSSFAFWSSVGQSVAPTGSSASRSEEHTSELQSLMRKSYAVFCLTKKKTKHHT